ncbi:autotransporter adhesin [Dyella sp. SG562]|nr:autotransporter adhesin [Dyella sp. SG562]
MSANDAVNVSQLSPVVTALGGGATIDATTGVVTGPTYILTNGGTQTTVGGALSSLDTAITNYNKYYKVNTYSSAADAVANGTGAIAIGAGAVAGAAGGGATDSIAIGLNAQADGTQSLALGRTSRASGVRAVALSDSANAAADNSLAVGYNASVAATSSGGMALGANSSVGANAANSVALGYGSVADQANTISVGTSTAQRKIVNVAAGELSASSHDVVIGSQLYTTNQNVTNLQNQISNGSVGLVQQDATSKKITVASGVDGDTVDFSGTKDGATISRKITGVSDGEVSATSKDAVNGSQLYAIDNRVMTNESDILALQNGTTGLVKQDATTQAISVGASSGGTSINFANSTGAGRVLSGIANGVADSDAVTIAQLKAAGLVDGNGKSLLALVYDDLTMGSAMLGGSKGTVIRNLANGSVAHGSMEAINGGQLFDFQQDVRNQMNALNGQINALNDQVSHIQEGINNGSIGGTGTGGDSASLGVGANASGDHSTAVGTGSNASGAGSTATGAGSSASGDNSTANGANAIASGGNSTANGNGAQATGNDSTASGAHAIASGEGSTANGTNAVASGNNSTALGSNSSATGSNSVALGANSSADRDNTVSVGSAGNERQITNVAAGTQATDAANWGQVQDAVHGVQDWATRRFEQVDGRIDRMGAMGAAYSQMAFSATGVNTPNRVGVGVGMQGGKSAVALGVSHQFSPNVNVSFGGSASGKEASVGAGMAIGW